MYIKGLRMQLGRAEKVDPDGFEDPKTSSEGRMVSIGEDERVKAAVSVR